MLVYLSKKLNNVSKYKSQEVTNYWIFSRGFNICMLLSDDR